MGFGPRWMRWMEAGVFNSNMSILVNGSPTDEFKVHRGLRQGDPLSPFLYTIVAEGLAGLVGLRVNMWKSKLYGIEMDQHFMQAASQFLCCKLDQIPFKFLGVIVGGNPRSITFWEPVLVNMRAKLSPWIGSMLSIGGRVALINSVLTNLPIYYMSFYKLPKKVVEDMVRIQRNFLWHNAAERNGVEWIGWRTICKQ
ncbi:uncharacterized protein LOC131620105 [Vicia villosa]|uniref:uncharacterized protein LOC131620105 n=1 Tax=Vicia villosa TaxID=3911 RepID=UPI00273B97C6|nr:uncharacterized protein LOC131620105 [Vicia villosa]